MPAGLSQTIQLNRVRSSAMILLTPPSVSASLSLVWEAGSSHKLSRRLSRMRACERFAIPCTTLMKSNTTRRSAPRTRSRLRRPTSKSITTTFCPICASVAPRAAVEVVLPTPPLPDVTTRTLAILVSSRQSIQRCNLHDIAIEPHLRRPIAQIGVDLFGRPIVTVDGEQLGFDFLTVDTSGRITVDAGHRATAKRPVDVDGPAGDDFGAGTDRAHDGHVAIGKDDRLTRTHLAVEQQRGRFRPGFRLLRLVLRKHATPSADEQGRHHRREPIAVHSLDTEDTNVPLLQALDKLRDRGLTEVDSGEVKHHGLADKKTRRLRKCCVDLFKPLNYRNHRAEHEGNIRPPAHANRLTYRSRNYPHDDRLALSFRIADGLCSRESRIIFNSFAACRKS